SPARRAERASARILAALLSGRDRERRGPASHIISLSPRLLHIAPMNKREFIRTVGGAGLGLLVGDRLWAKYAPMPVERLAMQEDFWETLRGKYRLTPDYINLENGYYSMQSQPVLEAFI